jgi:crotonobetainyl-CoA:carnitine CoA-transferase CaiB-like acyl-CoA transferase
MIARNQLTHAVVWPNAKNANVALVDCEGTVLGEVPVSYPLMGSELAKRVPDGYSVQPTGCNIVSMSGRLMVQTCGVFDTAVVTERPEVTFEERLARMERREANREKALAYEREKIARLEAELAERDTVVEPVEEPAEPEEATQEPEAEAVDNG